MYEKKTEQICIKLTPSGRERWNEFKEKHTPNMTDSQLGGMIVEYFIRKVNRFNIWWILEEVLSDTVE